ncbi:GGDEF domain-containing protein [Amycolatopsis pigmentata]|uniref:GGDEF domain-containing protein n=1 Tax=Amycolatopsis pigmentata TaxID=450801 RepID=A0ABW5FML2_9PSEU
MYASPDAIGFVPQPLYSLHTGGVVGLEILPRPGQPVLRELFDAARRERRLPETDIALAARAAETASEIDRTFPLHLNISAPTVTAPEAVFGPLLDVLAESGRRPREVVLEVGPPFSRVRPAELLDGLRRLGDHGFRIALDGVGHADLPAAVLTAAPVSEIKLDRGMVRGLPEDAASVAFVEALLHFTARTNSRLVATGVTTPTHLDAVRRLGVRVAQGELFAATAEGSPVAPLPAHTLPDPEEPAVRGTVVAPRVRDFLSSACTLPEGATCDDVRTTLIGADAPTGVVGVDADNRPQWTVDRTRFLAAVTGQYGHALHAKRPASRLADKPPHVIDADAPALELLELVADADWGRGADDVVVVDNEGRCAGIVLVTDVVRGMAEVKIEEAAALNPLTRLPGSDTIARDVERRIDRHEPFVTAWLDVDAFKAVNDTVGFAAGDDLIRALGRTLTDLAARLPRMTVGHVGGDDFLIVCDVDEISTVAAALLDSVWSADGMAVTVSLATLVCATSSIGSYPEASRLLAPLKKRAKAVPGSSWVLGRPGSDHVDVLRGLPGYSLPDPRREDRSGGATHDLEAHTGTLAV